MVEEFIKKALHALGNRMDTLEARRFLLRALEEIQEKPTAMSKYAAQAKENHNHWWNRILHPK